MLGETKGEEMNDYAMICKYWALGLAAAATSFCLCGKPAIGLALAVSSLLFSLFAKLMEGKIDNAS